MAEGVPLGHLPAPVARHLAPLLDSGRVIVECVRVASGGAADAVSIVLALRPRAQWRRWRHAARRAAEPAGGGVGSAVAGSGIPAQIGDGGSGPWTKESSDVNSSGAGASRGDGNSAQEEHSADSSNGTDSGDEEPLPTQAVADAMRGAQAAGAAPVRGSGHVLVEAFKTMVARVRWAPCHYGLPRGCT